MRKFCKLNSATIASAAGAALIVSVSAVEARNLNIALSAAILTLDPHQATAVQTDVSIISHLYSPLVIRDPDYKIRGVLAESWKALDDNTWQFKLKPGIKFPNGEALDASAVKANFDRLLDPATKARVKIWFDLVTGVEVDNPLEFRIKTRAPFPGLIDQLSMLFIMAPQWARTANIATTAMGTGPYELKQYAPGDRIVLQAKKDYFGGKVDFEDVTIRMIPEPAVRVAALLAGELDLILDVPPTDLKRINASKVAQSGWGESSRAMIIKYNDLKPPFSESKVLRQALNHAIDRQGIINAMYEGHGRVSNCQMLSPMYFGYNPDLKPYAYDPAKAKQMIAQSGLPQPIALELEVPLGRYLLSQEIGQVVASQLEEVGLKVTIKEMEFATWSAKYTKGDMGQMAFFGQAWPTLDADGLLSLYDPSNPGGYWKDQTFAEILARGRSTVDPEKRKAVYKEATARMCDEAPVAFLFNQPLTYATSNKVEWKARGDDWVRAYDVVPK